MAPATHSGDLLKIEALTCEPFAGLSKWGIASPNIVGLSGWMPMGWLNRLNQFQSQDFTIEDTIEGLIQESLFHGPLAWSPDFWMAKTHSFFFFKLPKESMEGINFID